VSLIGGSRTDEVPLWAPLCQNEAVPKSTATASAHSLEQNAWVVVPIFNEAEVIGPVVDNLTDYFAHVVCIDDGSSDNSAELARQAGARVLQHPMNLGQGAALQTGFDYVCRQPGATHVITFDADGQHLVSDALEMLELAKRKRISVVFGSRFLDKRTKPGLKKRIVLKLAVLFTRVFTGLRLTDAHNGLRVLSMEALGFVRLEQNGMSHATEIVHQIAKSRLAWREYPVEVLYTEYSKRKGQSLWNSVNILIDLIVR
jgi:polyprenyl-phospho-N-acetylgalactosaminyl synthase